MNLEKRGARTGRTVLLVLIIVLFPIVIFWLLKFLIGNSLILHVIATFVISLIVSRKLAIKMSPTNIIVGDGFASGRITLLTLIGCVIALSTIAPPKILLITFETFFDLNIWLIAIAISIILVAITEVGWRVIKGKNGDREGDEDKS